MSDYGVPSDPEGALPWSWAEERLVANRNYWVVTASANARPSSMPVWGVWLPSTERFWFSCSPNARKARNIATNSQCASPSTTPWSACRSRATPVSSTRPARPAAVDEAVATYIGKYWDDPAVHAEMEAFLRGHALFEVTPRVTPGSPVSPGPARRRGAFG